MAGDSQILMDHNMEIGVTPAQVKTDNQSWSNTPPPITGISPQQEECER